MHRLELNMGATHLLELPEVLLADCLALLDLKSIGRAAQTCSTLHHLVNNHESDVVFSKCSSSCTWNVCKYINESPKEHARRTHRSSGMLILLGGDRGEIFPNAHGEDEDEDEDAGFVFGIGHQFSCEPGHVTWRPVDSTRLWSLNPVPDFQRWRNAPAAAVGGDAVHVIGGWDDEVSEPLASVELLRMPISPTTGEPSPTELTQSSWEYGDVPSMPEPRCFAGATFDSRRRLYVCGGGDGMARGATCLQSILRWDPEASDPEGSGWEQVGNMLVPRCGLALAADWRKNLLYLCGGYSGGLVYQPSVETYDMETGASAWLPPMRHPRSGAGAGVGPDGSLYVCGGSNNGHHMLASFERYDARAGRWQSLPKLPTARGYLSAAFGLDECFYVAGGCAASTGIPVGALERFDTRAGKWHACEPIPRARSNHALVFAV